MGVQLQRKLQYVNRILFTWIQLSSKTLVEQVNLVVLEIYELELQEEPDA